MKFRSFSGNLRNRGASDIGEPNKIQMRREGGKALSAAFGRNPTKTDSDTEYRGNSDLSLSL